MITVIRNNGYVDDNVSNNVSRWEYSLHLYYVFLTIATNDDIIFDVDDCDNDDNNNNINYSRMMVWMTMIMI